ncbi:MAG TPA: SLBB domain-containing protein [Candidatus Angelobacter sp.]
MLLLLGMTASACAQLGILDQTPQNQNQQNQSQQDQQSQASSPRAPYPAITERPKVTITNKPGDQTQLPTSLPQGQLPQGLELPLQPSEPDIEFQQFVANSLGYRLPIFGQNLFENVPSTFAPLDYVPVTPDYLIGPGDELVIRGWGQIDITNYHAVVDRTGAIYLPTVGAVSVAGVRYDRLNDYLKQAVGRYFKNFDLDVTLGRLRSIQVFVVGQVRRPGSYTISSLSTLVNALFASGGPSKRGSMRNIQLKRSGRVVTTFDLYDLIAKGDKSKDAQLMPGDVIYVPAIGPLVAMAGSVNVPAVFELRDHDTLADVIAYAGGLTSTAAGQQAIIERIDGRELRRADEFPLTVEGYKRELRDGDIVRFLHISGRFDNAVTLRGNVAVPGRYPWHEGMRVKDLIPNRESLVTEEYWRRQNNLGQNPGGDSLQLQEQIINPSGEAAQAANPNGSPGFPSGISNNPALAGSMGAGNARTGQPGTLGDQDLASRVGRVEAQRMNQEELKNQIKRSAAEINWEYAVVQRLDPKDLTSHLLPFNLGKAIAGDDSQNLNLQPGDVITIFSQADMQVPIAQQSKFVRLEGEFGTAGIYQVEPGETLRHLVTRVTNFTPQAYAFGAEFTRESVREDLQRRLDEYVTGLQRSVESTPAISPEDQVRLAAQRQLAERMRQLRSTGRIVLELKPTASSVNDFPDMVLEDGDRLFVPFRPATVSVVGAVYNSNAFIFKPGKTVAEYLRLAGGPTRDGDRRHAFVLRANGATISNQHEVNLLVNNFNNLRLMPGDTIVVPQKLDRGAILRGFKDWSTIFGQFALGAAGIAALGL